MNDATRPVTPTASGIIVPDLTAWALTAHDLRRRYGTTTALDGVTLTLGQGEIICLLGASGCGKSTLLRLIAGVEHPDGGTITLAGRELVGPDRFVEPEARNIGFMFQEYALFPHLNVAANVAFGLAGQRRAQVQDRVNEVLAVAGVSHLADRFPHMLSGGEQQRVALARALAPRPSILLMDEPFSNLDQGLRETVRGETLRLLRTLGITAIIVTHDPQEALATGDRVVLMRTGRVEAEGQPRALYHCPPTLYAARFLGPGNSLPGTVSNGHLQTALGRFAAPGLAEGRPAVAFFRPQALSLLDPAQGAPARILSRDFQGELERIDLALAEGGQHLQIQLPASPLLADGRRDGGAVGLRLDPAAVRVLAADAAELTAAAPASKAK